MLDKKGKIHIFYEHILISGDRCLTPKKNSFVRFDTDVSCFKPRGITMKSLKEWRKQ